MNQNYIAGAFAVGVLTLAGCANQAGQGNNYHKVAVEMMKQDFQTKGIATADRIVEDEVQAACNQHGDNPPQALASKLMDAELAKIKYPADGNFMGDWKAGEKLAQSGRGMTWSDKAGTADNGGNCYNCHKLSKQELSFGTIGPSLNLYGVKRGNTPEVQKTTYGRIYNAKAYNLCSNMPRFGHKGILSEQQLKDLVALLLDPESPVNKK